ncbi:hypothetical protein F5X99DRAFT_420173 [Biscogniauxia marginata]|nr:hypothetical protein F5X99DRAFT_420173 [Biscogniauxia marginata]
MSSNTLFIFGDQTGDVKPTVQELSKIVSEHANLQVFFRQSIDRLKSIMSNSVNEGHQQILSFDSLYELAAVVETHYSRDPALKTALLCIVQFGAIITHLEVNLRALEISETSPVILGICTGALTAAAVSCCRNLTEIIQIATDIVQLAYRLGCESAHRSRYIDISTESWANFVSNVDAKDAQEAIELFNEQSVLEISKRAYISSQCNSSITVSGPPHTLSRLCSQVPLFKTCRWVPLPIYSAFHAGHLQPVSWTRLTEGLSDGLLNLRLQHPAIISPSSGQSYAGANFSDLLVQAIDDILQVPINLEATFDGLSQVVQTNVTLVRFGPVNLATAMKKSLEARKIHLVEAEYTHQALSPKPAHANDIAIVGMSVRLPKSETLEEFWQVLEQGRDLHEKIRPDRFNVETHFDVSGKAKNTTLTPYGVFIDRPGYFDTRLFNMSPREAVQTDPQQRLMLLTTYEALEMAVNASQNIDTLNYHFGWEGPSYSVDTACSSSAASIQLACSALLAHECDTAIGGGANLLTNSDLFAGLSRGSFLSKTGGCKTFDHDADGYVRADAVGVVVLKRLNNAIADRDNILAVIKGATTNHSAEAVSITHPHASTQERLFNAVLNKSGTQAGDVTDPLYMGTVKPNIGHGEAASGVSSLIKAVMMFKKNTIPPHIGIKLNTHISFGKTPFLACAGGDRKRGNTSMVIEEPPLLKTLGTDPRGHHVVRLLQYVKENPDVRIEDIAYTTTARHLATSLEKSIADGHLAKAAPSLPSVIFLFTGQGSCYLSMASELFESYRPFRENIQDYERICTSLDISQTNPVQVQLAIVSVELAVAAFLGEYPALYTAGVISLSDCLYLVGKRASIMLSNCTAGTHSMLAVHESAEKVESLLLGFGSSISKCEIAGSVEHISENTMLEEYSAVADRVHFQVVTNEGVISSEYLKRQTRDRATFNSSGRYLWIETGPNPVSLAFVRSTLRNESDWEVLSTSLAMVYAAGIDVDWVSYHRPYELCNYWIQYKGDWTIEKGETLHRILSEVHDTDGVVLNKALRGHLVNGSGLCPSSVYADMAFTAAGYILVYKPLLIQPATKTASSNVVQIDFSSQDGQAQQEHAHCVARIDHLISSSLTGQTHRILRPMAYKLFAALVDYDPNNLLEATAKVKFQADDSDGSFTYSPYWIDSVAHLSGFVLNGADTTPADSIVGSLSAAKRYQSYVRMRETKTPGVVAGDVYFFDDNQIIARAILDHLLPRSSVHNTASKIIKEPIIGTARSQVKKKEQAVALTVVSDFDNILSVIASEVGVELSELGDDASFTELGVDSLLSMSIVARLGELLGEAIPVTLFNNHLYVRDLRTYFDMKAFGTSTPSEKSSDDDGLFSGEESHASTIVTTAAQTPDPAGQSPLDVYRKIIASELGLEADEIDKETPLSEYGVDSLISLSIMSAVNSQTGRNLPPSFLVDNPTLAAIELLLGYGPPTAPQPAQVIRKIKDEIPSPKAEAVLLQGSPLAQGPTLFLLPDGSGMKICGAVYGLNSPYLESPESFTSSLQSVVEIYIREIRRVQPHGPYSLGGWSIGGTYAFEAASQLIRKHGEKVECLILIDAPCPMILPPLPLETIDVLEKIGAFSGLQKRSTVSSAPRMREGVRDHFHSSVNALKSYQPTPIDSDQALTNVTAIWARNGVWETVGENVRSRYEKSTRGESAVRDWIMDQREDYGANGWEMLLPEVEIICEVVTGDHFNMMRHPGVEELGGRLAEVMRRL